MGEVGRCGGERLEKIGTGFTVSRKLIGCWVGLLSCQTNGIFFRLHKANRNATVRQRFPRPVTASSAAATALRSLSPGSISRRMANSGTRAKADIDYCRALHLRSWTEEMDLMLARGDDTQFYIVWYRSISGTQQFEKPRQFYEHRPAFTFSFTYSGVRGSSLNRLRVD